MLPGKPYDINKAELRSLGHEERRSLATKITSERFTPACYYFSQQLRSLDSTEQMQGSDLSSVKCAKFCSTDMHI